MRSTVLAVAAALLLPAYAGRPAAQTKTLPGEMVTIDATVEAIDAANRVLTLKGPKGNYVDISVPKTVTKFDQIKVGDSMKATYYDNVVLTVQKPGETAKNSAAAAVTKTQTTLPGGTIAEQRTITAVIDAIDPKVPSISFKGPKGWQYSTRVHDKEALKQVKVGDKVDITWTTALLVSFDTPKS
jgi:hypothetical protein